MSASLTVNSHCRLCLFSEQEWHGRRLDFAHQTEALGLLCAYQQAFLVGSTQSLQYSVLPNEVASL